MNIILNGKEHSVEAPTTIADLLRGWGQDPGRVVVEYNGQIIAREAVETAVIKEGDLLEVVRLVGGG
jgi:thiamine biosynthesis protein ThiS